MVSCYDLLFHVGDEFNRYSKHNCNFKFTQSLRLLFMTFSFAIWALLLYVWAKAIFAQLQFYTLTLWLYAITSVACSSGREVVEVKMVSRLQQEKLKEGLIKPEQVDEVELPSDEKSGMWKLAQISYSLATPLIMASPIMFLIFSQDMLKGEVCKFVELAGGVQNDCLSDYENNPAFYQETAGFRYTALMISLYGPLIFFVIEFFLNQLLITWKHLVYQYLFTLFYALVTLIWQVSTKDAVIFPNSLDWICASRDYNATNPGCLFDQCILWFLVFMGVQTGCFTALVLFHYAKSKFCCRRSHSIVTFDPMA